MKHLIAVGILVALTTLGVAAGLRALPLAPIAASAQAGPIDALFGLHLQVIAFLFSLIIVFMLYSLVVFRRKPGDASDGKHIEGHTGIEVLWTIVPLGIVLYFAYLGAQTLAEIRRVDPQALQVKVTARQWAWTFEYPGDVTSGTLNLPVNRQVLLKITSKDVIHSFWVPEFRVKQDAVPGDKMVKDLVITPDRIGEYKVRCAEMCGTNHAYMEAPVAVMATAQFDAWLKQESETPTDPVARGRRWATKFGCIGCHTLDGSKSVGPSWQGVYGKTEEMADGSKVVVDDAYLIEAITQPAAKLVKGYGNLMPATIGADLTADQIQDLIALIRSLK